MKNKFLSILVILFITALSVYGQMKPSKTNPAGTWKFEAPFAPEGYQSGTIVVGQAEKQLTAALSFTGNDYKIPGEKVKHKGDSLSFSVYLDGGVISVGLKLESDARMSGVAKGPEGDIPLTLTRQAPPAAK